MCIYVINSLVELCYPVIQNYSATYLGIMFNFCPRYEVLTFVPFRYYFLISILNFLELVVMNMKNGMISI